MSNNDGLTLNMDTSLSRWMHPWIARTTYHLLLLYLIMLRCFDMDACVVCTRVQSMDIYVYMLFARVNMPS